MINCKTGFLLAALLSAGVITCNSVPEKNGKNSVKSDTTITSTTTPPHEMYTCKMHNQVLSDHAGTCSICGMTLLKQELTAAQTKLFTEGSYKKP
jgi:Heavy metal binding domain